jgi:ATP-dependent exoDNAse (exonuclease V) alpha subunit
MTNEDNIINSKLNSNLTKSRANVFGFTDDQKKAYFGLIDFINSDYNPNDFKRALIGAGGVGKTYLLKAVIQNCNLNYSQIGLSAPSHKACRVLRNSIRGVPCNVNTIQSDFGFKPNYDIEKFDINNVTFSSFGRIKVEDYSLYIVDESSMLNRSLIAYIDKIMKKYRIKLIYCGDDLQIPPVNERDSYAFKGVQSFHLNQIVRQDEDNPIRELTELLRNDIKNGTYNFLNYISKVHSKFDSTMTKGFVVCNSAQFQAEVEKQFSDEAITRNTDYVKVVAYTNKSVSNWNKFIREAIIKDSEKSVITKNDLITSYTTIVDQFNDEIIRNSEDYIVKDIANYTHPQYGIKGFMVKFQAVFGGQVTSPLFIIDHRDKYTMQMYCKLAEDLIQQAKNARRDIRAGKWKDYYKFKESCLLLVNIGKPDGSILYYRDLDYGFSISSHKSQGSTYNVSMVDVMDIVYDKYGRPYTDAKGINKRLYVAISRAKEKVYLRYGY